MRVHKRTAVNCVVGTNEDCETFRMLRRTFKVVAATYPAPLHNNCSDGRPQWLQWRLRTGSGASHSQSRRAESRF